MSVQELVEWPAPTPIKHSTISRVPTDMSVQEWVGWPAPTPIKHSTISRVPTAISIPRAIDGWLSVTKSTDFYWETSIFLVENVLFRVPRHQFIEKSETFRAKFELACQEATSNGTIEGDTNSKPIKLQGVSKVDFERLLKFMSRLYPFEIISHEGWISILKLSTMWEMTEIRNAAIAGILECQLKIDATERISLGKEHNVPMLVTSGIVSLVNQRGGVSEKQIAALGLEMALRIQCIRVKLLEDGTRESMFPEDCVRAVAKTVFHGEWSFEESIKG
ncbi:hypothetical protein IW261DRAFT_1559705 [Armillaria novae-zelandiae]|uniref:BTB domain-containing protein n=1 Tax=Armillaria novae-zelandiae TaxID=153914 RepID=A0AA39UNR0_9AGAR|nr:hypothetical protein IW261DRAFT_1559705 [Armillaria novae-zelandiae]